MDEAADDGRICSPFPLSRIVGATTRAVFVVDGSYPCAAKALVVIRRWQALITLPMSLQRGGQCGSVIALMIVGVTDRRPVCARNR
jgi:hypothetical protein